mgnify:CR=1 FL=1
MKESIFFKIFGHYLLMISVFSFLQISAQNKNSRERIKIREGWKFMKYESMPDSLIYDERDILKFHNDNIVADTKAEIEAKEKGSKNALKAWVLPTANDFIKDKSKHYTRPENNPVSDFPLLSSDYDDTKWENITIPHDWAIKKNFYVGDPAEVGGGMGRLPIHGVAWYRNKLQIPKSDQGKKIYLEIDGAMSYAIIWLNGKLVGGWPYGYNSFRLDLTPFVNYGKENQLSIRIDNPNYSSRWYTGGGIYRNVWLVKTNSINIDQYGTFIKSSNVTKKSANIDVEIKLRNHSNKDQKISVETSIYLFNKKLSKIAQMPSSLAIIKANGQLKINNSISVKNPKLWGVPPTQEPNLYKAITKVFQNKKEIDSYETIFGIRDVKFDPSNGIILNGEPIRIKGVNQHHDLGALGAAFNIRAAERQLEILKEMGVNAIRMAHNPPAPELLDLTDKMGFMIINEIFDSWKKGKTPNDYHLIFSDWYEADTRAFVRRDKNHPSVIAWSFGNEVGEQYTDKEGAAIAKNLNDIVKEEDSTRPTTASMNYAKPDMPFPATMDFISLNYQGEGIRNAPAYSHLKGIRTKPLYPDFKEKFPNKLIVSSETASTLSTRGSYCFPVTKEYSAPVSNAVGYDDTTLEVSDYGLYTAQFGASPDKVFDTQDHHPYVAGEFVWSGFDYLGEPTPYYSARSSYSGIIDLAGFKKDRFYQYQARWRPDFPMVHILPHWNWPDRIGKITPIHIFTSGDEVELFVNGKSYGKKKKDKYEYRLRWDDIIYQSGEVTAVAYKNGKKWAEETVKTTGEGFGIKLIADRTKINADGDDLAFITVKIVDKNGCVIPNANNKISFSIDGNAEIVATDNGNPADLISFASHTRNAFSGLALVIIKSKKNQKGSIKLTAKSDGLETSTLTIESF